MTIQVNLPEEAYRRAVDVAEREHCTVEQLIADGFLRELDAWDRLVARAAKGSRKEFLELLARIPDGEPDEHDRLPEGWAPQ
ncbi:MAG: hypothetical protein NTV70_23660 [Acidobacteria bacterium]|nr:hypothetical protein [Acidobacteriota bacterium]